MKQYGLDEKRWLEVTADYRPGCGSAPYTFVSLHCGATLFGWETRLTSSARASTAAQPVARVEEHRG
jgi:hypothetical protein